MKEAISAKATTATTFRVNGADIFCSDTRMDYGVRTSSSNLDALITGVRCSGHQVAQIDTNAAHRSWGNQVGGPLSAGPPETFTISGGVLDITNAKSGLIAIAGEGGLADDLDTITSANDNHIIFVRRAAAVNIVLKHGTGNILCFGDADVTINSANDLFEFTKVGSNWVMLRTS